MLEYCREGAAAWRSGRQQWLQRGRDLVTEPKGALSVQDLLGAGTDVSWVPCDCTRLIDGVQFSLLPFLVVSRFVALYAFGVRAHQEHVVVLMVQHRVESFF